VSGSNVARRDVCSLQAGPKRSTKLIAITITRYDPYPVNYGLHYQNQGFVILRHQIVVVTIFFNFDAYSVHPEYGTSCQFLAPGIPRLLVDYLETLCTPCPNRIP